MQRAESRLPGSLRAKCYAWSVGYHGMPRFWGWSHMGAVFELQRVTRSNPQEPGAEANRRQRSCIDLFVDLFSADEPIARQLAYRDVGLLMRTQVLQTLSRHAMLTLRAPGLDPRFGSVDRRRRSRGALQFRCPIPGLPCAVWISKVIRASEQSRPNHRLRLLNTPITGEA
jgi:hypothetical protein